MIRLRVVLVLVSLWIQTGCGEVDSPRPGPRELSLRVTAAFSRGDYQSVVESCTRFIDLAEAHNQPVSFAAYSYRGLAQSKLQQHDEAIRDLTTAIEIAESAGCDVDFLARLYRARATEYRKVEPEELSLQDFDEAGRLDSNVRVDD